MEYKVLYRDWVKFSAAGTIEKFIHKINEEIKKGWIPQGGICSVAGDRAMSWFLQAMIKNPIEGKGEI